MACTPWLFVQRARMYLTSDDLASYLGIVKAQPDRAEEVRAAMILAIQESEAFERQMIQPDEYHYLYALESQLREPAPVNVGWNSELTKLFGVEVVG